MNAWFDVPAICQSIEALYAEYPEIREDELLRADMLEGATALHEVLAELIGKAMEARSYADATKARRQALGIREHRFERQEEGLRKYAQRLMEQANLPKIVLPEATIGISFRKPELIVTDEQAVPEDLMVVTARPDIKALKARYAETGTLPPGCGLSNGKSVLTVRT